MMKVAFVNFMSFSTSIYVENSNLLSLLFLYSIWLFCLLYVGPSGALWIYSQ